MRSILTDPLPAAVEVFGRQYPIETDFRVWLRFDAALSDRSLSATEKTVALFEPYKEELPPHFDVAAKALLEFYAGYTAADKKAGAETPEKKAIYSFLHDAPYIYAAFLRQYGIDLTKAALHWLQFRALFAALGEDEPFVKIMEYRSCDVSKIRDKQQKSFYRRMQERYRLPDMRTDAEKEKDMIAAIERLF